MGINEFIKIGNRIKELRISKGITQKDMAKDLGINRSTYSNYENDIREPSLETINKIASALGVDVTDLLNPPQFLNSVINKMDDITNHFSNVQDIIAGMGGLSSKDILSAKASSSFRLLLYCLSIKDAENISDDIINSIVNSDELKFMLEHLIYKFTKEGDENGQYL